MSHPRIEEVEDSDVEASDPSEGDIEDFADSDILRSRTAPSPAQAQAAAAARSHLINPSTIPSLSHGANQAPHEFQTTSSTAGYGDFQCLYPVYFDATRSRAEGRRVDRKSVV